MYRASAAFHDAAIAAAGLQGVPSVSGFLVGFVVGMKVF
jgi:hypothetical protein